MMYLTTGTNGAGKTLLTLWDVRQQQIKENRPVYFRGFTPNPILTNEFGWQEFDPAKWQDLPDGSICVFDEAQEVLGTEHGKDVPQWIQDIAKYRRKRGFDFWLVTPHPMLLHTFVRRLIEKPSWHRHLKRAFGAEMVSELKFGYVESQCEKPGSGANAQITMQPYRKEVYGWYQSASLHTAKKTIPRAVWVGLACVPLALALIGYGGWRVSNIGKNTAEKIAPGAKLDAAAPGTPGRPVAQEKPKPMTAQEYVEARMPRIAAFPHTAAAYDGVTQPTEAPYPAACVDGVRPGTKERVCHCYTQQATRLELPLAICQQIARNGFFMDWKPAHAPTSNAGGTQAVGASPRAPVDPLPAKPTVDRPTNGVV
jgi:zona occludens toxin